MPRTLFRSENTKFMYFEQYEGSAHSLLAVKNAKLYAHDFSGARSEFGSRSICVEIPEEIKDILLADGWEIKVKVYEDIDREPRYYLPVNVKFNKYGPEITKVAPNTPVSFDESTADKLDDCDMTDIDILISPYKSERKDTLTAYLRELRFKLRVSPLDFEDYDEDEEIPNF